jgi:hypothetical protein
MKMSEGNGCTIGLENNEKKWCRREPIPEECDNFLRIYNTKSRNGPPSRFYKFLFPSARYRNFL